MFVVVTEECAFMTRCFCWAMKVDGVLHWEFPRTVNYSLSIPQAKMANHDIPYFDFLVCMLFYFQTLVSLAYFVGKIGANWKTSQKNCIRGTSLM